jgi:alanine racemase
VPRPILQVNLSEITTNYQKLKSLAGCDIAAVVKANAYGLGGLEINKHLHSIGCDNFFVAYEEEAEGFLGRVFVLSGQTIKDIPVLSTLKQLTAWDKTKPCVIHIDSGMNRLGISLNDVGKIKDYNILYIATHLTSSDEGQGACDYQASVINDIKKLGYKTSIQNSCGVGFTDNFNSDLPRVGASLYGLARSDVTIPFTLYATIVQKRLVRKGESVGYGRSYIAKVDMEVATLEIGYADGLSRLLSNKGRVCIGGNLAPIVGKVSMDLTTIDITGITCDEGDMVEVIGKNITPQEIARLTGTIDYEVATSISARVVRQYVR